MRLSDRQAAPMKGEQLMPTRQISTHLELVTPLRERARDTLHVAIRGRHRRLDGEQRVMPKGAERC
jgi:hypothetical protein